MKKFFSYTSKLAMTAMLSLQINAADLKEIAGDTEMDKLWGERVALDAGERGAWRAVGCRGGRSLRSPFRVGLRGPWGCCRCSGTAGIVPRRRGVGRPL